MTRPTVLIVGGDAIAAGAGPSIAELAQRTRTGVLNTWRAKGLFRFDDPAHLGTIGLQRDDLVLAGVVGEGHSFDRVVLCGVAEGELPPGLAGRVPPDAEVVDPADLGALALDPQSRWPVRPPLYDALATVCAPAYHSGQVPLSPIRAAGDLAAWLPDGAVVVAGAGEPGFWLARTFPTRAPGTVQLPARPDPAFPTSAIGTATGGVIVVCGPDDASPLAAVNASAPGWPWVVVERWTPDGPALDAGARLDCLSAAVAAGGGEVEVGVALGRLDVVEEVAGPVVVWGGPSSQWSG